jgi:hypothetical protein
MEAERGSTAEVVSRLDKVIALLRVGFGGELSRVGEEVDRDPVSRQILELTEDWIPAGDLTKKVADATGKGERTVRERVGDLVELGLLESEGATRNRKYRSSGLIDSSLRFRRSAADWPPALAASIPRSLGRMR